jgi:hypothetical protein
MATIIIDDCGYGMNTFFAPLIFIGVKRARLIESKLSRRKQPF